MWAETAPAGGTKRFAMSHQSHLRRCHGHSRGHLTPKGPPGDPRNLGAACGMELASWVRGISLPVITPLLAAVAMVMGHSTELYYSPLHFDLFKKNSTCVWSPRSRCRARGAHALAAPCQATWEPGPEARLLPGLQGQGISTAGVSASSAQRWVLGAPLKGSPPPKSEGVKEKEKKSSLLFKQLLFKGQSLAGRWKTPYSDETKGSQKGGQIQGTHQPLPSSLCAQEAVLPPRSPGEISGRFPMAPGGTRPISAFPAPGEAYHAVGRVLSLGKWTVAWKVPEAHHEEATPSSTAELRIPWRRTACWGCVVPTLLDFHQRARRLSLRQAAGSRRALCSGTPLLFTFLY